jgi:hypothetical protein
VLVQALAYQGRGFTAFALGQKGVEAEGAYRGVDLEVETFLRVAEQRCGDVCLHGDAP